MKCKKCYSPIEPGATKCPHCGKKQTKLILPLVILLAIISVIIGSFLILITAFNFIPILTDFVSDHRSTFHNEIPEDFIEHNANIEVIKKAQQTVYTIYTDYNQGSGFLYDDRGYVITNAHVVEGSLHPIIRTNNGDEFEGQLVGYSNEIDVALIYVPQLKGETPFPQEKVEESSVVIEVVALGTPLGKENTATFGYLTGVNRTFHLPPHQFNNVYQISAPIEPGNSGGPLLSLNDKKIIAINAAKRMDVDNIAFSIPLKQVVPLVNDWIDHPMSKTEISSLFYHEDGNFYFDYLWSLIEEYFFEDGYYLNDEDYQQYWYYEDEWDFYDDEWDNDDEWYYDNEWDWNMFDDEYWNDEDSDQNEWDSEYEWKDEEDWSEFEDEWFDEDSEYFDWELDEDWEEEWDLDEWLEEEVDDEFDLEQDE